MRKLITLSMMLCSAIIATAQYHGEVRGVVLDPAGNGMAGVHVEVLNTAGSLIGRGTQTDADGRYDLDNLNSEHCSIQFNYKGYRTTVVNSVIVNQDKTTALEIVLKPAKGKEIEVVEYVKPLLDFQKVKVN